MLRFKRDDGTSYPEWERKKLSEICDVRDGTHDSPRYTIDGYPFITSKNLTESGTIDFENINYISKEDYEMINKRSKVDIGDLLFGMIGTIGKPVIVKKDGFAIKNVALIKPQYKVINNYYLYNYFQSNCVKRQFLLEEKGGTQKFLALGVIRNINVLLPCLEEQQKIADFLSEVDNIIAMSEQEIESLEMQKKGAMQKIFSQEVRFKADDGSEYPEWEEKKIGNIFQVFKGAPLSKADITEIGIPLILYGELYTTYKEVAKKIVRKTNKNVDIKYYSKIGDVVIPTSGETAEEISTATCVMCDNVILAGDLNIYRSNEVEGRYFSYLMNHCKKYDVARIAQGASVVHVQASEICKLNIFVPILEEQQKIADFLSEFDNAIEYAKEELEVWKNIKKGLLQQMFE